MFIEVKENIAAYIAFIHAFVHQTTFFVSWNMFAMVTSLLFLLMNVTINIRYQTYLALLSLKNPD